MPGLIKEDIKKVAAAFPKRSMLGEEERSAVNALFDKCIENGWAFDRYDDDTVDRFEQKFAAYFGLKHAAAVSSGTAAVHSALAALKIEPFSEVISSPITDPGAVAPILWMNCIPVFADTEKDTFNMSAAGVEAKISEKTKAIIVGHIGGDPCDMDGIMKVARKHGIPVIEDCSQAHDALYKGKKAGTFGDIGVWSLMSGKHHTAGGQGGMVVSNNAGYILDAKRFADRGKPFGSDAGSNLFLGLNYRMTSLEAVIGMVQLDKLAGFVANRRKAADAVRAGLSENKGIIPGRELPETRSARWFLTFKVDEAALGKSLDQVIEYLKANKVPGGIKYSALVYEQKWIKERHAYGNTQYPWSAKEYGKEIVYEGSCPNAKAAVETHFIASISESWTESDGNELVRILKSF